MSLCNKANQANIQTMLFRKLLFGILSHLSQMIVF